MKDSLRKAGINTDQFIAHSTLNMCSLQARAKGVPIAEILKVANWSSKAHLKDSITEVKALLHIKELFSNQTTLAGMLCALNVPLVSTVPCIWNLWNTIHRFLKDEVQKGRMDCMKR